MPQRPPPLGVLLRGLLAVALLLPAVMGADPASAAVADDLGGQPLTERNVRAFLDRRVPELLAAQRVPGAAVVVVSGGRQLVAEGYGVADVDSAVPVDPAGTAFPLDSVTKSLTATAVMQQVEQGRLDLDADVNDYLTGFRIADTYPGEPVTLRRLLTHTAGFEETLTGMLGQSPEDRRSPGAYLAEHQPERVYPPGRVAAYSNYGYILAGHLVEIASGQPFEEYVTEHVLRPLGMRDTVVGQPDEAARRLDLARTYTPDGDGQRPVGRVVDNSVPAGGGYATVTDVGRYLLAQLGDGRLGDAVVLSPESAGAMRSARFQAHPALPGTGFGFQESPSSADAPRTGHGGDGPGSHGRFQLFPDGDAGIYVVANGDGRPSRDGLLRDIVVKEFAERFFPEGRSDPSALPTGRSDLAGVAGSYVTARMSRSEFIRALLMMDHVDVDVTADGSLTVDGTAWVPHGPDLFRHERRLLALIRGDDGRVIGLAYSADPATAYLRAPWYAAPGVLAGAAAAGLLLLLSTLVWPAAALARRLRRRPAAPLRRVPLLARILAGLTAALAWLLLVLLWHIRTDISGSLPALAAEFPLPLLPLTAAAPLTAGVLVCAVRAWRQRWWRPAGRVHYTAVAVGAVLVLAAGYAAGLGWPNLPGWFPPLPA
ncbi:serine hydrolase domain-containing protein [Marinactinospora rubrisoli]|uniref:Serine hydrolase domain-containing protein n=1 Tax=Marinactinospora rubrisoli TaxID=2715399 RepID=A0ABW2KIV7_9ACTN